MLTWKFPIFPALKKLHVEYGGLAIVEFETNIAEYFRPIDYAVGFPVLEVLQIFGESVRGDSFLPDNRQVVESVREVDVRTFNHEEITEMTEMDTETLYDIRGQAGVYVRLLDIFPNARDCVMACLRKLLDIQE